MAAKTFWHFDVGVNGFGKLDEGSAPTEVLTSTAFDYSIDYILGCGLAVGRIQYGALTSVPDCQTDSPGPPSSGNSFRSLNTLNGTFAAGNWTFSCRLLGITGGSGSMGMRYRLFRSANADGSSAAEITAATQVGNIGVYSASVPVDSSKVVALGAVTLTNEYLFVAICLSGEKHSGPQAGGGRPGIKTGTNTFLTTPNFNVVYDDTISESASSSDLFAATQVFAQPFTEAAIAPWGAPGIRWTWVDGVWGGATLIDWGSTAIYNVPISESRTATDSLVTGNVMPVTLTEARTAADSFVPNLVVAKTLSEAASPSDSLSTQVTFNLSILEQLADYWGTPGILWGASTGTWGGDALDSFSSTQNFVSSLTESGAAVDTLVGNTIYPASLSEARTATDVYVPGLVMPVALTESGTAADALTANNLMVVSLLEQITDYWGTPGILWGFTTGTWGGDVNDSISSSQIFQCSLAESANAVDTPVAVQVFVSSLTEPVTATDIFVPNLVITQSLSEASGAIDILSTQQVFRNTLLEFRTATDALSFSLIGSTSDVVITNPSDATTIFGPLAVFGIDISCFPDFDPLGRLVSGLTGLCQRIARRLTNSRGQWFWAPNECTDARRYLNEVMSQDRLAVIQNEIEREVLREEAVKTTDAKVTFDFSLNRLTVSLTGLTSEGPFNFVFGVTSDKLIVVKN